ncbi:MAG TPA: phospholipase A [Noviherbaspirillum sp.]|nr:phospholipase A [Noviherbaspirillum sp.]
MQRASETADAVSEAITVVAEPLRRPAPDHSLSRHWELGAEHKRGTFRFAPHRENYLIATYNHSPNEAPYSTFRAVATGGDGDGLSHSELAFQLGFKLKLAERPGGLPVDFWFGYTQRSFWQASNRKASSPFRETNYEPEIMAVTPMSHDVLGMKLRFLNFGLVHQSNGQASTLSRSWNRAYVEAGLERDNFTLLARLWKRLPEQESDDDNPDITKYMGHGDLVGTYRHGGHELSLMARYNPESHKGAMQAGWAFPINSRLKGYVQYFSGYGHTLIDYNAKQKVLGAGVLITY